MEDLTVAIIGGTGKEGSGLALRWAKAGLNVVIGSRQREKAQRVAQKLSAKLQGESIRGLENRAAAETGDVVVLSVPYTAHRTILSDIRPALNGKVLIDVTNQVNPRQPNLDWLCDRGAAAVQAQAFLGPEVRVVAAFQNIAAPHLQDPEHPIDSDVLVCGDDPGAKAVAIELAQKAGMRAYDAGPLENAAVVEGLTVVLIAMNKRYKVKGAGIRVTGI